MARREGFMRVALGVDHGGFPLKHGIAELLRAMGHELVDAGAYSFDPADDYPDFARAAAEAVLAGNAERGILVCGSGAGASIAANKFRGIRAALCHDTYSAHQAVEHDNMNMLCLGARVIGPALAAELVRAYLGARFSGEERHVRRLAKIQSFE
jgi:ribose 5-phosphate isomerase B